MIQHAETVEAIAIAGEWSEPRGRQEPAGAALLRRHARTFRVAACLLPRAVRNDLATLYGFCRSVDDAVDEAADAAAAERRLAAVLHPGGTDPVTREFHALAAARGLPVSVVNCLVDCVRSDLGPVRVADERALMRYAHRVAGTVGLMICAVLEVPRRAHAHAVDLGMAMQLTNIARDVVEDARRDRVYLPGSWVPPHEVLAAVEAAARGEAGAAAGDPAVARTLAAVGRLLELARRHYRSADAGMIHLPASVRPGILAASRNYEAIGTLVGRRGVAALADRSRVGGAGKTVGLLRAGMSAARLAAVGDRAFAPHDARLHEHLDGLPLQVGGGSR